MSLFNAYMSLSGALDCEVARSECLARHTSYRIGGPADLYLICHSVSALQRAIRILDREEVRWVVMGGGSNVLVSDEGFKGCVIRLGKGFAGIARSDAGGDPSDGEANAEPGESNVSRITVGAATSLPRLVNDAMREGHSGLEMLVGVPGTLGGAITMNAGSRYEWIGSRVLSLVVLRPGEGLVRYSHDDIVWGYRSCSIPAGEVVLEAELELTHKDSKAISQDMERRLITKRSTQPITEASCGSVFRNPEQGGSVAMLVEELGLKGYSVGGARISEKHANFIVNTGNATAEDVIGIIRHVHEQVKEGYGIDLQTEVRFLGFA